MHVRTSLRLARACWLWGDDEVRNCSGRGGIPVTRSSQDPPATLQEGCRYYRGARVGKSNQKNLWGRSRSDENRFGSIAPRKSLPRTGERLMVGTKAAARYSRMEEGTLALRACSCKSSSCFFASSSFFCLSAICSLNCASSLSHELALRRRLPASA